MRHRSYVGIDSIHFLNNSLDNLVRTLEFYPHDYWDTFQKLKEGLPSKDKLYNVLTNCAFSDKNYEHVLNVWKAFEINTMKHMKLIESRIRGDVFMICKGYA